MNAKPRSENQKNDQAEQAGPSEFDRQMMQVALTVASRGHGRTAPNPAVGAVIANEATGEVIARGWTQPTGRPHAETEALRQAGDRARGQTIYVTLEPCSHYGKTAPCADAIIQAGVGRVVVAVEDPDPRVSGRGLDRIRAAGIKVTRGVRTDEAHASLRGHIVRVTERRPLVQLKMALDQTGEVARGVDGKPVWVTGELARRVGHMLRAKADAILIGAGTLRDDDPALSCRLPGLENRSPRPVIVAGQTVISPDARLLSSSTTPSITPVLTNKPILAIPSLEQLESSKNEHSTNADVVALKTVRGQIWLPALAEALVARGITRLLVEGGPTMWKAFLMSRMADEIVVFKALGADGLDGASQRVQNNLAALSNGWTFTCIEKRRLDNDGMFVLRPASASALPHD
ncbi:MAG: bifunctional diaminohydroxyphosphoribosylaminopyrimidine deaminase/5-amino-6-(5-phosphoribosylamino)uracil reductase RibD [Pseudomonadota bacterium]